MRGWLIGIIWAVFYGLGWAQAPLGIADLRQLEYGQGRLEAVRLLGENEAFRRYLIRWTVDGLQQYGFLNQPKSAGPHPVIAVLHGYVNPANYRVQTYTTRYADHLARQGYLVLHPNYRGHPPSQGKPEGTYRIGYALDVLHLIALVRKQAGQGVLRTANPQAIGLWGHSMGGGIAQRVAAVDRQVRAVLLYGSMSGNERQNARQIYYVFSNRSRGLEALEAPEAEIRAVSPIYFLQDTQAAFSIHHGTADTQVPAAWSRELCQQLKAWSRRVECYSYANAPHTFSAGSTFDRKFLQLASQFFDRTLR
jgi:dienelactone hydrolase